MTIEFILLALIFFLAGVTPEITGFGVATVSMALLPFFLPLDLVIPLVAIISVIATGIVALQTKTKGITKYILPLIVGSSIGVFLGMIFLLSINEAMLQTALGAFLVLYSLFAFFYRGHFLPMGKMIGGITGVVAGFFAASFNVHGPLVGLYSASNGDLSKIQTKDLIATYMFIAGSFTVIGHTVSGRMTGTVLLYVLFALPFVFLGLKVENTMFKKIHVNWVKRGVYIFVFISGLSFLIS